MTVGFLPETMEEALKKAAHFFQVLKELSTETLISSKNGGEIKTVSSEGKFVNNRSTLIDWLE